MRRSLVVAVIALAASGSVFAADNQALSPELQKLDISAGRWVFHGQTLATPSAWKKWKRKKWGQVLF